MKERLALVRATHLNGYLSVLSEIGAPVDRELVRSKLPRHLDETPDLFVSIPAALSWIARAGHDLHPMELGLLGARNASLSSMLLARQAAIITAQTGLQRLEALAAQSWLEDTSYKMSIRHEANDLRVICDAPGLHRHPFVCLAEWMNLEAVISIVRSVAGPSWHPSELCFVSSMRPTQAILAAFPNTRILVGQPHTSVIVGRADLALPTPEAIPSATEQPVSSAPEDGQDDFSGPWDFVMLLRKMVQPYLIDRRHNIAFMAEMAGMSTRTLQRRLKQCGNSYSQIVQEARFELAFKHLDDPAFKIIDVAMTAGYESPQHFSRAFRRFAGITPSEYRNRCV